MTGLSEGESRRRRRGLRLHIIWAMVILGLLILVNAFTSWRYPWWLWVLMGWLPLIALHTAWTMGLFGRGGGK